MIRLKNILAENMLRFGSKNLSESDKRRLQSLLTEATETLDSSVIKTGAQALNTLIKTIPVPKDENSYDEYITSGYFLQVGYIGYGDGSLHGDFATDMTERNPKTNIISRQSAYTSALMLAKYDPEKATTNTGTNVFEIVYVAGAPGNKNANNIEKHIESFRYMIGNSSLKQKDKTTAYGILDQINTKIIALTNNMQSIMDKIPKEDHYYGRFLQLTPQLELQLVDQDETNSGNLQVGSPKND